MTPGNVYIDPAFEFSDGSSEKKIIISLSNPSEEKIFIIVKTTSNPSRKTQTYGCNLSDRFPNFHFPKGTCLLHKDTWVDLGVFYEFDLAQWLKKHFENGKIKEIGTLPNEQLVELLQCAIQSDDILGHQGVHFQGTLDILTKPK